jgi:hypothetical protein
MVSRRAFVAATSAAVAFLPSAGSAFVQTSGAPGPQDDEGRTVLTAVSVIVATQRVVRTAWRPPSLFPPNEPVALYVARGGDSRYPNDPVIWLNPDHPELVSPRISRLTDEVPLLTEYLIASVDVKVSIPGSSSLGLERVAGDARRAVAASLAGRVAVISKYTAFTAVDDAEFARRTFAFAVLRQMTPQIGGVASFPDATKLPSGESAVYAGRDVDARAPAGWGVIYAVADLGRVLGDPKGYESWVRAFVMATADRQPPASDVKRAYDAAAAQDAAATGDHWAARRAFAGRYVAQVAALFGR